MAQIIVKKGTLAPYYSISAQFGIDSTKVYSFSEDRVKEIEEAMRKFEEAQEYLKTLYNGG